MGRKKLFELLKNFSYTLTSNLFSVIISALVVLVVPKFIGVKEYGFWQLYIFYTTYVGFLHFGWNDGIYLREGGNRYDQLNKSLYFSQFYMQLLLQLLFAIVGVVLTVLLVADAERQFVIYMTALCMIITNVRYMLLFLLQATNKIKEYSRITILDRVLYGLLILGFLFYRMYDFKLMVYADIAGKFFSLLYAAFVCKDIIALPFSKFSTHFKEITQNIKIGSQLMFSNIASKLIIGNVRFGIERVWSIAVFGQLSLTLSISAFMMVFVSAISLVLFPFLRNVSSENLPKFYLHARNILMFVMSVFLFLYFPLYKFLDIWLPQYKDGLKYMAILFPLCLYEGKMSMLISTYLKVMREEKVLLKINLLSLLVSLIVTGFTVYLLKNIDLAVLSIILLTAFRAITAEFFIMKKLSLKIKYNVLAELLVTIGFIVSCWYLSFATALIAYVVIFSISIFAARKDINGTLKYIANFTK